MTRNAMLKSINCTSCGAGLDVLGGGRVTTHICPYCGTELDALDDYKALRKFAGQTRPESPISIGMTGQLFGVEFVVIGTMGHEERWQGRTWRWIDHQIFSPTHGYAWLTLEDGHFTFSRRFRDSVWMSSALVETSEQRPSVYSGQERFAYYDSGTSKITFVEGEFTWRPAIGTTTTVNALSGTAMLSFSSTAGEREIYRSTYLSHEQIEAGFEMKLDIRAYGVHPLQPFVAGPDFGFLQYTSLILATICLILAVSINNLASQSVLQKTIAVTSLPAVLEFPVESPGKLTKIQFQGDGQNSWLYFDIEVSDPEDVPVFATGRTVEYYVGRTNGESWAEGRNFATLYFSPEIAGVYTLWVGGAEADTWDGPGTTATKPTKKVRINISNGHSSGFWLMLLAIAFGSVVALQLGRQWLHHRNRWAGSDWTDDD